MRWSHRLQPQVLHVGQEITIVEQQRKLGLHAGRGNDPVDRFAHRDPLAAQLATAAVERLALGPERLVAELASNDGDLLQGVQQRGTPCLDMSCLASSPLAGCSPSASCSEPGPSFHQIQDGPRRREWCPSGPLANEGCFGRWLTPHMVCPSPQICRGGRRTRKYRLTDAITRIAKAGQMGQQLLAQRSLV